MTRRNILSYALAATGMAVLWPRRAAWSALTRQSKSLRFVFCTDVHAAPQPRIASALERAAASIRSRDAVFVIVAPYQLRVAFRGYFFCFFKKANSSCNTLNSLRAFSIFFSKSALKASAFLEPERNPILFSHTLISPCNLEQRLLN